MSRTLFVKRKGETNQGSKYVAWKVCEADLTLGDVADARMNEHVGGDEAAAKAASRGNKAM